jgi:hypothetical protein
MIPFPPRSAEQFRALVQNSQFAAQRVNDHVIATMAALDLDPAEYDFDGSGPGFVPKPPTAPAPASEPPPVVDSPTVVNGDAGG